MSFEMAAWCFPLSPVSYQLSALFLESRQRIVVSSEHLPTFLPVCFLLESKTQIATGFWAHCVCFSLVPGPIGQGDKMIIHSPRCERRKHLPSRQHGVYRCTVVGRKRIVPRNLRTLISACFYKSPDPS